MVHDELSRGALELLGRELLDSEATAIERYLGLIASWNRVHRIVGSAEIPWLIENVVLDSLLFLKLLPDSAKAIVDIGSGVGVPGIPLCIVGSERELTLVESRRRRASFLSTVVRELGLRCRVIGTRAELVNEIFDAAVARCVGAPREVVRVADGLVRSGGVVIIGGPPDPEPLPGVEWVVVSGWRPGMTRRLGLHVKP